MDTPNGREKGQFNWGSTAWHELTHAFTLGASDHRVPRWLSEGLSVLEERRVGRGWGADATVSYVLAMANGTLRPISQLSDGFLRPRFPEETQFSYYAASLFCEMVEASRGAAALPAMLKGYRDGMDTPGVFQKVLGTTPRQIDAEFEAYTQRKFALALGAVRGCLEQGGCQVVPGLPQEQWLLTLSTSILGGLVVGFAAYPRKEGRTVEWTWVLLLSPLWLILFGALGLGPILTRTSDLLPILRNSLGFLGATVVAYLLAQQTVGKAKLPGSD
jgi:hypothetical protein